MSSERSTEAGSPEEIFLARLADVAPVAEATEQVHLTAALAAVREAEVTAAGRRAARPPVIPWRKPRMALSNVAAIIAGLSLPLKAAAASTVAVAAIGGGVAVTSAPENPPADTPAAEALLEAEDNTGFPLPARGQPSREEEAEAAVDDDEAKVQDEHENNGLNDEVLAEDPQNRSEVGKARAAENRAAAEERAAEARANAEDAEARQDAAAERRAEAEGRAGADAERADGKARGQQARGDATTTDETDVDATSDDAAVDDVAGDASKGADASSGGRAKAGAASGR